MKEPRQFTLVLMHPRVVQIHEKDIVTLTCSGGDMNGTAVDLLIGDHLMGQLAGKTVAIDDLLIVALRQAQEVIVDEMADASKLYLDAEMKLTALVRAFRKLAKANVAALQNIHDRSGVGAVELEEARAAYRRLKKLWKNGDVP